MKTHDVNTCVFVIECGLKQGYEGKTHTYQDAVKICQTYCDKAGLCVKITLVDFIYTGGSEDGVSVQLMNYPRYPKTPIELEIHALNLAELLMRGLNQQRVSMIGQKKTKMLKN